MNAARSHDGLSREQVGGGLRSTPDQRRQRPGNALQEAAGNQATAALLSGDAPLTPSARSTLEQTYGVDLGGVRVHSGPDAAAEARARDAAGFTQGQEVYLATTDPKVMAHELAHTVQQADGSAGPTLSEGALEAEAEAGGEVTVGGAAPGAVQKEGLVDWLLGNDEKKPDPQIERKRTALLDELQTNKDAWKRHLDDPLSAQIMQEPGGIIRHSYEDDPEFKKWLADPTYRPPGSTPQQTPQQAREQTPQDQMEQRRKAAAAIAAHAERADRLADEARKRMAGRTPQQQPQQQQQPQEDWATRQNRMSLKQRAEAAYEEGTSPKTKMERERHGPLSMFIGDYERSLLEFEHALKSIPFARAGVSLEQIFSGEDILGRKVSRLHAAVETLTDVVLDASLFLGPEDLMELGAAEARAPESLAEAAMSEDVTGTTTGMTEEAMKNMENAIPLPEADPLPARGSEALADEQTAMSAAEHPEWAGQKRAPGLGDLRRKVPGLSPEEGAGRAMAATGRDVVGTTKGATKEAMQGGEKAIPVPKAKPLEPPAREAPALEAAEKTGAKGKPPKITTKTTRTEDPLKSLGYEQLKAPKKRVIKDLGTPRQFSGEPVPGAEPIPDIEGRLTLPKSKLQGPQEWLKSLMQIEEHHLWPKYLGGLEEQTLKGLSLADHKAFHNSLKTWKSGMFDYQSATAGYRTMQPQEILGELREFYGTADGGRWSDLMPDFERTVEETLAGAGV